MKFWSIFHRAYRILKIENIYGRVSSPEKVLIVVITSNRGLCGAFNTNVINETQTGHF